MSEIEALRSSKEKGFIEVSVFCAEEYCIIEQVIIDVEMDLTNPKLNHMNDYLFELVDNVIVKTKFGMTSAIYELR